MLMTRMRLNLRKENDLNRVELAARYSNADIDRRLFRSGIAIPGQSTQEVRTTVVALNWFVTENVRVSLAWFNTIADEPLIAFGGGRPDSSFLLRIDINF